MRIIKLTAENVKRLRAVTIKPDGSVVQITGRNGQGKSSVLDSIMYALGGKDVLCERPVRKGAEKAKVTVELDDLTVTRTFTAGGGGALTVAAKDGAKYPSPQAVLDKMVGKLSFDPLAFARMNPKQQAETLRGLVGLDFSEIDRRRSAAFDSRTVVGREVKQLEAQLAALPEVAPVPAVEVSVADLMRKLEDDIEYNRQVEQRRADLASDESLLAKHNAEVTRLEEQLETARRRAADQAKTVELRRKNLIEPRSTDALRQQIKDADAVNARVRTARQRESLMQTLAAARKKVDEFAAAIDAADEHKRSALAAAPFPVPGLSFNDSGVLLNDVPFGQASAAEQLRVSVAMGLAANPTLRVILIRDGSLLDSDSLAMIERLASESDAQIWMERVSDGEDVGVVIEDGATREEVVANA
jgi:DNA repair exonuclease SbcCD ATPase subunit